MSDLQADAVSRYLAWSKLHSNARFNLAASGVLDYPLAELPVRIDDLQIGGTGPYGYKPLMGRLAAKAGVPEECVVYTFGTSMANYIALSALVHRADEVLVERPTYDPLLTILDHLGAKVCRFERRAEKGFRLGLGELERKLTRQTRLVVLCNLHNPSSSHTDESTMRQLGEMAAKMAARVLVDEVYLETLFRPAVAFRVSPWAKLCCDQQPDQGLRFERHPLWMDTGAAGTGAAHVADR